jgi:hypothetical protein
MAKGQTDRVERSHIGDVGENWRAHSESDWMNHEIFGAYLRHLREQRSNGERILFICDVYASRRTADVKQLAGELNISLRPAGCHRQASLI